MLAITFPSELVETVIDQIYWDAKAVPFVDLEQYSASRIYHSKSLDACGLVSKSWLPRSRHRLFKTVTLDRGRGYKHRWKFLASLKAPLSTITPYVQHLTLEEEPGRNKRETRWLNAALPQLTVLSAIKSLAVDGATFEVLNTEDTTGFFTSFPKLKELRLSYSTFRTFTQVVGALSASLELEVISLDVLSIQAKQNLDELCLEEGGDLEATTGDTQSLHFPPPSHLKTLATGSVSRKAGILKWLTSGPSMPPVESL
jgi:hypothetical protein